MNIKSTFIAAATAAMVIFAAPAVALAQAAPGGNAGGSAGGGAGGGGGNDGGEGGTYGFGSAYHSIETGEYGCDYMRKRAQWSDSFYWWRKHSRCVAASGS